MTTIRTTTRPPATRARDDKKYARRGDVDEDADEALARARDEAVETVRCPESSSIRRHRLTDDAQAARAVERARDSVGENTAMRTDDADAAIERAKRAMVLGRRVSEKTRKKRREDDDDDDATATATARLALVRDRATLLVVDARERVKARARAVVVDVRVDDSDDE